MNIEKLDAVYKLYKFQVLPLSDSNARIYSFKTRYYSNADIIILNKNLSKDQKNDLIEKVATLGYAVQIREYQTIEEAENSLFDGFFDIDGSKKEHLNSYNIYKKKIELTIFGNYEYINSEFIDETRNLVRSDSIIQKILSDLKQEGPVLVMLEAAAGFGKTSTSYEVLKHLVEDKENGQIPLFTELSRNRQASIFKYVLYDEIDRRFTAVSLDLVNKHIIDGRIPVIIDGFDELLKNNNEQSDDRFEDAEPMLETIKELLKGQAKIILTTRRTAIFSDDEFSAWLHRNVTDFSFMHYSISEPSIQEWISGQREKDLKRVGLNLKSIANPVLLSYLRSMTDEEFSTSLNNIDQIIDNYIHKLMDREMQRQELTMSIEEQHSVLKSISDYFAQQDITSENRDSLEKKIYERHASLLHSVIERYPIGRKPSIDQLVSKVVMHAFLDKKGDSGQQIGFVNEFILGTFVGQNLIDETDSWLASERFLDFLLVAYIPRDRSTKLKIYEILNRQILSILSTEHRAYVDNYLFGCLNHDLENAFIADMEFRNKFSNGIQIKNVFFSHCEFYNIDFDFHRSQSISFINCTFYGCTIPKGDTQRNVIDFTNCISDNNQLIFEEMQVDISIERIEWDLNRYQRKVLEKFWPSGKERFIPHKRPGTLRLGFAAEEIEEVHVAIDTLIKNGILIQRRGHHSLELNIEHIIEIKKILGR